MIRNILFLLALLIGADIDVGFAQAQTSVNLGLATGSEPRNIQILDNNGTWITVGSMNSTTHAASFLPQSVAANSYLGNASNSTGAPSFIAITACSSAGKALTYTSGTGFGCNTTVAAGPASAVSGNLPSFNGTTGQLFQDSGIAAGNVVTATSNFVSGNCVKAAGTNKTLQDSGGACGGGSVTSVTANNGVTAVSSNPITTTGTIYANGSTSASGFRLTLTSGTPVMTTGVTSAGTIDYTPYIGNYITVADPTNGNDMQMKCVEMSNVLANSSVGNAGPAAVVGSGVYDLFVWNSGSASAPTCTLTRGPAWTNSTTRSLTLTRSGGLLRNNGSITNGPGTLAGTYVGTFVADGSGATVSFTLGGVGSGGIAPNLNVWNNFNRVGFAPSTTDSGAAYTYAVASWREARASTGNQINFVIGVQEEGYPCSYVQAFSNSAISGGGAMAIGIGVNSTTSANHAVNVSEPVANNIVSGTVTVNYNIGVGVGFVAALENCGTGTCTYDNDLLGILSASMRM